MKATPKSRKTPAPDLLAPVVAELKKLDLQGLNEAAKVSNASTRTLMDMRDMKFGPKGPSYFIVAKLYEHLVAAHAAPG